LGGLHFTRRWKMGDHLDTPSGVLFMASSTSSASIVLFQDSASEPVTCWNTTLVLVCWTLVVVEAYIMIDDPHDNILSGERQGV
jgi:hypothetical protein